MWFLLLYLLISAIQGLNRVALWGSDSPCKGRLQVYRDGQWGLVCHHGWNNINAEVVCRSLGCGGLSHSGTELTLYRVPPLPKKYLMDQVKCKSTENSLWNCPHVGSNIEDCENNLVAVECSGNVTLSLNMNGQIDKCAGAVQFSTEKGIIGICNSEWDKNKAKKICQELNCGEHYYIPKPGIFKGEMITQYALLKCADNEQYSWQCAEWSTNCKDQASVICTKHRRFRLRDGSNVCSGLVEEYNDLNKSWVPLQKRDDPVPEAICTHLNCGTIGNFTNNLQLTCSGNIKLRNFTSKCVGAVYININGSDHGVCFNDLDKTKLGIVVCRELDCGEVLDVKQGTTILNGLLSNVDCQGDELSLWHCQAKHERRECKSTTVVCAGSLEIRLSDGLGRCSGRVEMKLGDTWKSISSKDWTPENSDVMCNHFGCGTSTKMNKELFVKGNQPVDREWKVKCKSSSAKPSECFYKTNSQHEKEYENIQIICQKEELMFFEGDSPCQGRVRTESFTGKSLPENFNTQKNKTDVCRAMQCGTVVSFDIEKNTTHANVKCSVKAVKVSLRNSGVDGCSGMVEVCRDNSCGGVCNKTWKTEDSKKLCENLGCGDQIKGTPANKDSYLQVKDYSVYCPKDVKNMNMCNFIPNTDFICRSPAHVICTASVKAKLEDPRDKCAGKVQLFYPGKWTPVCNDSLDKNAQNAICSELNCGVAESVVGPLYGESQAQGLSGLKCANGVNSVSKCNLSDISVTTKCNIGYLKCSEWRRLILYKKEGTCSGPVYAVSSDKSLPQLISDQGWGKEEGQVMCQYLQCGDYISHSSDPRTTKEWWSKTYSCSGKKDIWECESDNVLVQPQLQLNIKCDGKSNLTLSNNCTGEVLINKEHVCEWDDQLSHKVCDSLGCGKAIHHWGTQVSPKIYGRYFSCTGRETLLWQCASKKGKCDKTVSLACQESTEFSSTEKCGGKLVVRYRDKWEFVCGALNETDVKMVCDALNCKNSQTLLNEKEITKEIKVAIKCPDTYHSISQCVQHLKENTCKNEPAKISCEGYDVQKYPVNYGLIVGLLLGVLVLLVLIIIWRRKKHLHLLLRRYINKDDKDITIDANEMNNMGTEDEDLSERKMSFDKDDYEDVNYAQGEEDADDRSKGSSGTEYDDIERQVNDVSPIQTHTDFDQSLPLLPKRPENMIDDVTYEVEIENQENYDDVMPFETDANENAGIPTKTAQA
ncbi:scavenger receptor cysteine-rich type 1 protein M160 isoform X2 [Myxocyprinus asiaticus]|uniref:scavenger receptor cysteine-rich type 1 protein M160 isoform X2 n=1 Tax=Myxocyprinus asiaticus TaxID=70543 RepID=UPI0022227AE9|nr:scavenger receptor cysteine-rich type 1 protein M160 isoform X2 [Myxocyprinus asiaticus]